MLHTTIKVPLCRQKSSEGLLHCHLIPTFSPKDFCVEILNQTTGLYLIHHELSPLKVECQLADLTRSRLSGKRCQPIKVRISKRSFWCGPFSRVKSQHSLQKPQCTPICFRKKLLKWYPWFSAHTAEKPACLFILHLPHLRINQYMNSTSPTSWHLLYVMNWFHIQG